MPTELASRYLLEKIGDFGHFYLSLFSFLPFDFFENINTQGPLNKEDIALSGQSEKRRNDGDERRHETGSAAQI